MAANRVTPQLPWLISRLVDAGVGRMAVIVGGGPSAPVDLARIPHYDRAVMISANAHAFKLDLKPDFIWCKDHLRVSPGIQPKSAPKQYMERELRQYGVPIVGPNFWCDFRAPEWPLTQFNSGQQALAFAVLLGCAPIVAVGLDCFLGETYFHSPHENNISLRRKPGYWQSRLQKLHRELPGAPIRARSGPVRAEFGPYDPGEVLVPGPIPPKLARYGKMNTVWIRSRREYSDGRDKMAVIPKGYIMASYPAEAERLIKTNIAERVEMFNA